MEAYKYDVTIGMPVYGVEKYIRRCLDTVLGQTFQGTMEVLCVDDLGPDRSVEIIREVQQTHPAGQRIKILTQPKNMGCWAARNRVLQEAQGKYVYLLDSDDYISTDCIEKLYREAEEHQAEAVYGSVLPVDEEGNRIDTHQEYLSQPYLVIDEENGLAKFANQGLHPTFRDYIWNTLLRRDFLTRHHIAFRQYRFCDDMVCSADVTPLVRKAVLMPDFTYYYVIRDGSLSNYQYRKEIKLDYIEESFRVYGYLRDKCRELRGKPYFEVRATKGMVLMFYAVCGALKNKDRITPALTAMHIKRAMRHPLGLGEIMRFGHYRTVNLGFWLLGHLPAPLCVAIIKAVGKRKHYI